MENKGGILLSNTLLDYRRVDAEVRIRAKQVKLQYAVRVPQANWLRLDLDGNKTHSMG